MRTKKAILNYIFDAFPQLFVSIIGFVKIKLLLDILGNDTLGVYQLFGQLLAYVSFAELGLSNAIAFVLYKPIHDKNNKKINKILSGAKKIFNYVFLVMLIVGIILTLCINFFIKETNLSLSFIQISFFLMLIANIITYLVVPQTVLFDAEQNKYKYARYTQICLMIKSILELVFIIVFKSLISILILNIGFSIIQNIIIVFLAKKQHPWLNLHEKKSFEFIKKTKELIPHKIGMLIAYNIDVIIISKVLGLVEVVAYTSYMYIVNTIVNIISKISTASLAGIGDMLIDNKKNSYNTFLEYNSFVFYLATVICVPLFCVISQFISICYGKTYVLSIITVILFILIVFYSIVRNVLNIFTSAAGLFKETIICVVIEVFINLTLSLILVKYLGITGVLLGTFVAYIVSEFLIKPSILNKYIFKNKISRYYLNCFKYFTFCIIISFIFYSITKVFVVKNIFMWFILGFITFIVNLIIVSFYYYFILKEKSFFERIKKIIRR